MGGAAIHHPGWVGDPLNTPLAARNYAKRTHAPAGTPGALPDIMKNMKEFTFHNVRVTMSATDGKKAYDRLCTALGVVADDWETDTYSEGESEERLPTCDLFPDGK